MRLTSEIAGARNNVRARSPGESEPGLRLSMSQAAVSQRQVACPTRRQQGGRVQTIRAVVAKNMKVTRGRLDGLTKGVSKPAGHARAMAHTAAKHCVAGAEEICKRVAIVDRT